MNAGHGCVGPPYRQVVGWLDRCKLVGTGPRGRIVDQAGRWVDSPRPVQIPPSLAEAPDSSTDTPLTVFWPSVEYEQISTSPLHVCLKLSYPQAICCL